MKVIIADDDPTTLVVLSSLVEKMGHDVVEVADGEAAWRAYLDNQGPCLMLIDWEMPIMDGMQLCRKVKQESRLNPPYYILVTGKNNTEDVAQGLGNGADDYICKPFNATELMARICVAERTLGLLHELHQTRQALKYQATHDELTGLLNRRAVMDALVKEAQRSERLGYALHLAICDLDDFKQVNDTYGHLSGDLVLQAVARYMQGMLRSYDLVGRYGGEEFIIAISDDKGNAQQIFQRLLQEISQQLFTLHDGQSINLTLSIGSSCESERLTEARIIEMLAQADRRLYIAKAAGKNRMVTVG
ncbi:diguanylate cyclase [Pontibacter sp. JAM-7]|uniref:GGDEF domain-containing response regulator n=1 Tax=Pontibacter sp. JAM-7 TaxID=3366581 RepID=UPI003AF5E8B2